MAKAKASTGEVAIQPARIETAEFYIVGDSPLVIHAFSQKAKLIIRDAQGKEGAKQKKTREARNYQEEFEQAKYKSFEGWEGFNASGLRLAMIRACKLVGVEMTMAKMSIFVKAEGYDVVERKPLVRIHGTAEMAEHMVRLESGVAYLRIRPLYPEGWFSKVTLKFDLDQFSVSDVANLLYRAGQQVGIAEGRAFGKESAGMGWGSFRLAEADEIPELEKKMAALQKAA